MRVPVKVNISVEQHGKENIVAAVLDFHYTNIKSMIRTYDGCVSIVDANNMVFKILIPFEDMYNLYNNQHSVDQTFADEVNAYYGDNYKALKDKLIRDNKNNREDGSVTS